MKNKILLSFDIEEFDLPKEHGSDLSLEEGVKVSSLGLKRILKVLKDNHATTTFFVTGNFAKLAPELVKKIEADGHEVACHGVDHFCPKPSDIKEGKKTLESLLGHKIYGYRQPRMGKISYQTLKQAGYLYDSSVNPAFIPGRYNNSNIPRTPYKKNEILEIPTSVATGLRIPLFWLALHLFPKQLYLTLAQHTLKTEPYFATYFHPWEFSDIKSYKIPGFIKHNSGKDLCKRLDFILKHLDGEYLTYSAFAKSSPLSSHHLQDTPLSF